jgi:RNA polymerase sigma-70 factor (ECF subfamily)
VPRSDRDVEEWIRLHEGDVRRYVNGIVRNDALARDITQDTFVKAWRFADTWRGEGAVLSWLLRIARHTALDSVRRTARSPRTTVDNVERLPTRRDDMHDALRRNAIESTLATLSLEHREVLLLVDLLEYDYAEVATILDVPVGTVRSRLSRARGEFRDAWPRFGPPRTAREDVS